MLDLCVRQIPSITFFGVSQEEMVNVCADLKDRFAKSKTVPGTRSNHHSVLASCNKTAHKLTSEDREFPQFDFDKSLTKEIDIINIKSFSYVNYDTFWRVGIVTKLNVHESDLKIEFLHSHGPRNIFSWPSVADKCFVPVSNISCAITAPTTITGRMYRISDNEFEQTLKAYENNKMQPCIYKAVVYIWSFLSLGTNSFFFFSKFLATDKKLLRLKL